MIADVYSDVVAFPPKSPVIAFPSAIVLGAIRAQYVGIRYGTHRQCSPLNFVSMLVKIHMPRRGLFEISVSCIFCAHLNIMSDDNNNAVGLAKPFPGPK